MIVNKLQTNDHGPKTEVVIRLLALRHISELILPYNVAQFICVFPGRDGIKIN